MALKVELKPRERIIIGQVVIRNDEQRTRFFIDAITFACASWTSFARSCRLLYRCAIM